MANKVLIYGAGGFSGRLIARAAAARWPVGAGVQLLLGGRRADTLAPLAQELGLPTRVFALDDASALDGALAELGLHTVVNAAGPFADTALPLAQAAVRRGRHYVDITGEADVYQRVDDLGYVAAQAGATLVCGAGHSAAVSDLMLEQALAEIAAADAAAEVGSIRIAFGAVGAVSQGSVRTAWRSVREQVVVVRGHPATRELRQTHLPTGQLERCFDFGAGPRIASAANLLDLHTARLTAQRALDRGRLQRVRAIEAFIEVDDAARLFLQMGPLVAPLLALPGVGQAVRAAVAGLPEGPGASERARGHHQVLLQIDDGCGGRLADWRLETPDPYVFTAETVLGVVDGLLSRAQGPTLAGWRTPAELFDVAAVFAQPQQGLLRDCRLHRRALPVAAARRAAPRTSRRVQP